MRRAMKNALIAICFAAAGAHAVAEDSWRTLCEEVADLASTTMASRQSGAPMANVMSMSEDPSFEDIVISAYERPRYTTQEHQQRAIQNFRDEWYLDCVKAARRVEALRRNE
jgi:hypothetical protein